MRQLQKQAIERPTIMLRIEKALDGFFEKSENVVPKLSELQIKNLKQISTFHQFLDLFWSTKYHKDGFQMFGTPYAVIKLIPDLDSEQKTFLFKCFSFLTDPISIIHMLNRITNFLSKQKLKEQEIQFQKSTTWIQLLQHIWFIVANP